MLRELRIRDFAIIDELALEFAPGFNVFTGETGAGKSIIMQALNLLCGGRASPEVIRSSADEASIEGLFDLGADEQRALEEVGFSSADELVVRRLISRGGKNRVYLNGSLATLAVLERLGPGLIHVYGQHEQALLLRPESHLEFLDVYAGLTAERATMAEHFAALQAHLARLAAATSGRDTAQQRADFIRFQLHELETAALEAAEEEKLRREREVLVHAERLAQICQHGEEALYSGEAALATGVARVAAQVHEAARVDSSLTELADILDSAHAQIQEAAHGLRTYGERISFDPARREEIEDRLALLGRLKRKYGGSIESALATQLSLAEELAAIERADLDLPALEQAVTSSAAAAWTTAAELSNRRRRAARRLEQDMEKEIGALGMEGAAFAVAFANPVPDGTSNPATVQSAADLRLWDTGADTVEFCLSANPGEPVRPLARMASGGELSRIMLALKVLTAAVGDVPTLIFDEVDAGIGGRVADAVGARLQALGRSRQVLCITHLPQIAAPAGHHFVVEKRVQAGRTVSRARHLGPEATVSELSRMLGGLDESGADEFARRLAARRTAGARTRRGRSAAS